VKLILQLAPKTKDKDSYLFVRDTCPVNKYVLLQVSAHYLTHDDTVAGVVNLIKKLRIKRIIIGSRLELNLHLKHLIQKKRKHLFRYAALCTTCTQIKLMLYARMKTKLSCTGTCQGKWCFASAVRFGWYSTANTSPPGILEINYVNYRWPTFINLQTKFGNDLMNTII